MYVRLALVGRSGTALVLASAVLFAMVARGARAEPALNAPATTGNPAFEAAMAVLHRDEQDRYNPQRILAGLKDLERRFGAGNPKLQLRIDAERCAYANAANMAAWQAIAKEGAQRAEAMGEPVSAGIYRLCDLFAQGEHLDMGQLDALIDQLGMLNAPYPQGSAYVLRADIRSVSGDLAQALLDYQRAQAAYRRAGIGGTLPISLSGEAITWRRMGDYVRAASILNRLIPLWTADHSYGDLSVAQIQLGFVQIDAGHPGEALGTMRQAIQSARMSKDESNEGAAELGLALAQLRLQNPDETLTALQRARTLLHHDANTSDTDAGMAAYLEGTALAAKKNFPAALAALARSQPIFERVKNDRLLSLVFKSRAEALASQSEPSAALEAYKRHVEIEARLQKKMRIEQSALLKQEYEIQLHEFETRQMRVHRLAQEEQLKALKAARRWQGLALFATLVSLVLLSHFAWRLWKRSRKLNALATIDPLTRVTNRNGLQDFADLQIQIANKHDTPLSLLVLDLDFFKNVNDAYGHLAGDTVLKQVTREWTQTLRSNDLLGRFGGEEFLAVCPGLDIASAAMVSERLLEVTRSLRFYAIDPALRMTVSIGVAQYMPGESRTQWLARADRAVYQAKHKGRNRMEFADST